MTGTPRDNPAVLDGRTALITEAAAGMGRAGAELFAANGAHVILTATKTADAQAVADEIAGHGGSVEAHGVDLHDQAALDRFLETIRSRHDVIDVLYNNVAESGPREMEFDAASWAECMTLNVWVPAYLTQQILPLLRKSTAPSIIFTGSAAALLGTASLPAYSAAKGAIVQFMKSISKLLGPEGIRANAICQGGLDTADARAAFERGLRHPSVEAYAETVPLGRAGRPEDIATVALFLASDASRYMTGTVIPVDGGLTA